MFALRLPHAVPMQQVVPGRPLELRPGVPQVELPTVKKREKYPKLVENSFSCILNDKVWRTGVGVTG